MLLTLSTKLPFDEEGFYLLIQLTPAFPLLTLPLLEEYLWFYFFNLLPYYFYKPTPFLTFIY